VTTLRMNTSGMKSQVKETPPDTQPSSNRDIVAAAKGGGIIFFGRLFEYGSRFLFGIIVARAIGADGFGVYNLAVTAMITLADLATLGLQAGMVHFMPPAITRRDQSEMWDIIQIGLALSGALGVGLGLIILGPADLWAARVFHQPDIAPLLRWVSLGIPLTAVGRIVLAMIRGFKRMVYQVYADSIFFNVIKIGLTVVLLNSGAGVTGVLAAHTLAWILELGLLFYYLNRLFSLRRPFGTTRHQTRRLLSFSAPVCLTQLLSQLESNLELFLLGMLSTVTLVGIYSAALRIQLIGVMFLAAGETAAMPIISDLFHRNQDLQLERFYRTLTRWSLAFILPYLVTVLLFAGPLLSIFGKEFETGATVLIIVSLGTLVNAGTGICRAVILMTGHSRLNFINSLVTLGLNTGLNILLIPPWGAEGAAVALAVSVSAINVARLYQVARLYKLWPYDATFIKPVVASGVALGVGLVTYHVLPAGQNLFYLAFDVALVWSAFLATIAWLGLSEEDQVILSRARRRFRTVWTQR